MTRNHVLRVRLTANEYRDIQGRRGNKTLSDYIRGLITADVKKDVHETKTFNELLAKISRIDTEPLFAKLISMESRLTRMAEIKPQDEESTKTSMPDFREITQKFRYLEQLIGQVRGDTVSILTRLK